VIVVIYESEADARDKHIWLEETFAWKWLWRRMEVSEVRDRGFEMGEELDGDDVGAEQNGGSPPGDRDRVEEDGGQFTIADDSDDDDEDGAGDISGAGDEGARAFKAVVGNPPKPDPSTLEGEIQDPLQSASNDTQDEDNDKEEKEETIPCLIDRLFSCTIDLLFCAGFTVPESVKGLDGDKINVSHSFFPSSFSFSPSCPFASRNLPSSSIPCAPFRTTPHRILLTCSM
jgi:hypothetical protein